MKKVLIICPYFYEPHRWMISAYKTALYLSKKMKVVVLTTGRPYKEKINDNLVVYRMKDWFIPDPVNFSIIPGLGWHLLQVIKEEKPDYFLVNKNMFYTSLAVFWLRILGKKVITQVDTFPGINWFSVNKYVNLVLWLYSRTLGMWILKFSHLVVLLHEGLIPVAKRFGLEYQVIHNGVDFGKVLEAKPAADLSQKKAQEIRFVYVGRLESVKGFKDFVTVAEQIVKERKNIKFFLVGNKKGKEEYVKEHQNENIIFLGHREDVFSVLKTMDAYVLTSYSEGLPNALMEAMASKLACISSDVGGVKVLIQPGKNGLLYPAGDLLQLKKRILELADSPKLREELSEGANKTIADSFDWEKIAGEYQKLFNTL